MKHNLLNIEESLGFLRLSDFLAHTQMVQDFTFPVLSSYDILFKRYNYNSHNITFAQYGEREWNLSRRLCDCLEFEHNEFQKRKKASEAAILAETPRPHVRGLGEILPMQVPYYDFQPLENSVFLTLSPQILQKIIKSSPVTVDPAQFTYQIISSEHSAGPQLQITGSGNNHKDHSPDHVVIQLRVFQNPSRHSLGMQDDRITPSHTPILSRRGPPAPSEYFFGPHQDHNGLLRSNNMPNVSHPGIGRDGVMGHGFDVQTMVARMMVQAVREEKKRSM
ncbi:uncharacterized protein DFL_009863 [Arthrobotrys flagrans]|uniref:Uncharacterized protein n=1 Tax=Arthrobotrys flagrans TaxID=97331 RepID=A0A436ZSX2_ARTFL|nr:hypothetical protein DFL_009863 [Arthrobotrys flagrans]